MGGHALGGGAGQVDMGNDATMTAGQRAMADEAASPAPAQPLRGTARFRKWAWW